IESLRTELESFKEEWSLAKKERDKFKEECINLQAKFDQLEVKQIDVLIEELKVHLQARTTLENEIQEYRDMLSTIEK
ncbi:70 kDa neurofilament protein, partial [Biomphalaria pfeifferi]